MIQNRTLSLLTYNKLTADELVDVIVEHYFPLFVELQSEMQKYLSCPPHLHFT